MGRFNWSTAKNQALIEERGISFERVVAAIEQGHLMERYCQMLWMARERIRRFQAASFISPSMNGTPSMTWVMSL